MKLPPLPLRGRFYLFFFFLCFFVQYSYIQSQSCATDILHQQQLQTNSEYAARFEAQNELIAGEVEKLESKRAQGQEKSGLNQTVYTIPIVVHIMHHPDSIVGKLTNPPDNRVYEAIERLNEGFRNTTVYDPTSGTDVEIEFCLATKSPYGTYTSGITRYGSAAFTYLDFPVNDSTMKYITGWDRYHYMNIWITYAIADVQNNIYSYAGYTPPAGWHGTNRDGVVVRQDYFGTGIDNDKVLIHEVGHYLNLFHTFNGGCNNLDCRYTGDYVCDTPPDALSNGTFCNPINSCTTDDDDLNSRNPFRPTGLGGIGDQPDMIENYMDYGNKFCQTVFTQGQKDRMRISLTAIRGSILESEGCNTIYNKDVGITSIVSPGNFSCNSPAVVTLKNFGNTVVNSAQINYLVNSAMYVYNWAGTLQPGKDVDVLIDAEIALPNGSFTFTAYTALPDMWSDQNPANDSAQRACNHISPLQLPYTENFENAATTAAQWITLNYDGATTWQQTTVGGCPANGSKAMRMDNRNYGALGQQDYLYTAIDLFNYATASLTFDVSYALYSTGPSDRLRVVVSADCGESFTTLYNKQGSDLASATAVSAAWAPANCTHWKTETINLSAFAGNEIIIGFVNKCLNGNRLYLDNVNVTGTEEVLCFPPAGLSAGAISYTTATLSWSATEPGAVFNLKYRPVGAETWSNEIYYSSGTSKTIDQLAVGTTYEAWLQNACPDGNNSTYITTTFTTSYTSCPPPLELTALEVDKYSAIIGWEANSNAAGYLVYYAPVSSPASETSLVTYTNQAEILDLNLNVSYTVRVKTICTGGTTSPIFSPSITFTTAASCMPPNGVVVTNATPGCAKVVWDVEDDAVSYRVEHRPYGSSSWGSGTFVSSLFYNIPGLAPASLYEVRVRSTCAGSVNSDFGYTVLFQTTPPCIMPAQLNVISETDTSAILTWDAQSQAESYNVRYRPLGSSIWTEVASNGNSVWVGGLSACTNYEFQVQSFCGSLSPTCVAQSDYSEPYSFSAYCLGYCPSAGSNANALWIDEIALAGFTHSTGNNGGYNNYNLEIIELGQGLKIPLALTEGTPRKLTDTYWKVWIDYDQNLSFDPAELVFSADNPAEAPVYSANPLTIEGNFKVPETAPLGITRMRISASTDGNILPCDVFTTGEVEDYTVEITVGGGKQEPGNAALLQCYPNPAKDLVQFIALLPNNNEPAQLFLYNMLGQVCQTVTVTGGQNIALNVSALQPGVYWCQLQQNSNTLAAVKLVLVN
ncbi:T9SS C-terminal target domain-containing protein [Sphingobacteriales bacterium UPWRP_1]|nr:hypothetical protein B6N25_16535 [Sphingobacteriales bacterium TSM_CSS]PSJ73719.1 T9SS C-terminal target domain-containing protein [Sphingobacteriales bacterium UPWRP_1]